VVASYTYDSFGNLIASTGSLINVFRYAGREFDTETGIYFDRARYYDSATGRFLSEDPLGLLGRDVNFYRYTWNSPLKFRDPMGLNGATVMEPPPVIIVGGGAAVGGGTVAAAEGFGPTLSLVAGGSAEGGSIGGPIGVLVGGIIVLGIHDGNLVNQYGQALGMWGPSSLSNQRQREYERAKNYCDSPVPSTGNRCSDLSKQIDHALKCLELLEAFDARWDPGRHAEKIEGWKNRVQILKDKYNHECAGTGKGKC
jgi:type VI secretion system secreted protein VgrG